MPEFYYDYIYGVLKFPALFMKLLPLSSRPALIEGIFLAGILLFDVAAMRGGGSRSAY